MHGLALTAALVCGAVDLELRTNDIAIEPGDTSSTTLEVMRTSGPGSPADQLSGWQVSLRLEPVWMQGGGQLSFAGAALPTVDYVFDGTSHLGLSQTISTWAYPNDTLLGFDLQFPFVGGVDVTSADLLDLQISASSDAWGRWILIGLPRPDSEWVDSAMPIQSGHDWANPPRAAGKFLLADINVDAGGPPDPPAIPEPEAMVIWCMMVLLSISTAILKIPSR